MVSAEDVAKAEGELKVAEAQLHEAKENRAIAEAELNWRNKRSRSTRSSPRSTGSSSSG